MVHFYRNVLYTFYLVVCHAEFADVVGRSIPTALVKPAQRQGQS